jgi:asparagine synthase (glutamine-hydrolysing)
MCGLTGYLAKSKTKGDRRSREAVLTAMSDAIALRGPDGSGVYVEAKTGIGLAHRRLSVVELSEFGAQPMHSVSGRYVIVFNGEIYNHMQLRDALAQSSSSAAYNYRGHSDTETLLAAFETWGVPKTLEKMVGMFAFALWDRETETLSLARDRFGEKPLYYGWQGEHFLFGSELKSLTAHPAFAAKVDRGALCLFLRYNYIPAPHSIYEGIAKLEPGTLLTVSRSQPKPVFLKYWDAIAVACEGAANPFIGSRREAVSALETLLMDAVKQQMMSDVPLGAFLSGGVDSSAVVALMQAQSQRPVKTFTVGFGERGYNEAEHAMAVAKHLGTDHTELYVTPAQAMEVIPKLPALYCEPFADSSQIPTFIVSQLARKHVTVSLSGDGGDELFAGYNRYQLTSQVWKKLSRVPAKVRSLAARAIQAVPPNTWTAASAYIPMANKHPALASLGDKLHKAAGVLTRKSAHDLYYGLVSLVQSPEDWVKGENGVRAVEPSTNLTGDLPAMERLNDIERMMALDAVSYLPGDILCKVDRASMGVSLESRVPFLDHRVYAFAWRLPLDYKLYDGKTKWALREVLYRHVPKVLIERPKMGFGIPIHDWLRGPLREWAEALLSEKRLLEEGYFYPKPIRALWQEHLEGTHNRAHQLWGVLMFQAWLEENAKHKQGHGLAA